MPLQQRPNASQPQLNNKKTNFIKTTYTFSVGFLDNLKQSTGSDRVIMSAFENEQAIEERHDTLADRSGNR
jgi:hypothetical protein